MDKIYEILSDSEDFAGTHPTFLKPPISLLYICHRQSRKKLFEKEIQKFKLLFRPRAQKYFIARERKNLILSLVRKSDTLHLLEQK